MAQLGEAVAGSIEPLFFTLEVNGVPFPLDGYTVSIHLRTGARDVVTVTGTLELVANQTANPGKVKFTPAATDLTHNSELMPDEADKHAIRFKALDGLNVPKYFPRGRWDELYVYRE